MVRKIVINQILEQFAAMGGSPEQLAADRARLESDEGYLLEWAIFLGVWPFCCFTDKKEYCQRVLDMV